MYEKWLEGEDVASTIPRDEDPFWEPAEDVLIGLFLLEVKTLTYHPK